MPDKRGWIALFFIFICLSIPFGLTYYVSTEGFKEEYLHWEDSSADPVTEQKQVENQISLDQRVTLVKGERVGIYNTSLVYRGAEKGRVHMDLFLEELDPARAYPQSFPVDGEEDRLVRFGDVAYKVEGIGKNSLILRVHRIMGAK